MSKQDKYTRSAKGQMCQIRIPNVCNGDPSTTVLAHLNGAGMGTKHLNIHGAYACHACHLVVDGAPSEWPLATIRQWHLEGMKRTQEIMVDDGILVL